MGDLDPYTELAAYGHSYGYGTISKTIAVPSNAPTGSTLMRVMMSYDNFIYPCETFYYGEVEDYTLNIVQGAYRLEDTKPMKTPAEITNRSNATSPERTLHLANTNFEMKVFPNPASDIINIQLDGLVGSASITVFDNLGRVVWKKESVETNPSFIIDIEECQFTNGLYTIHVASNNQTVTKKVLIAK